MEAFRTSNDFLKKTLLLVCWNYCIVALLRIALIASELVTELFNKLTQRKIFVLIKVKELRAKDIVVMRIICTA